MMGVLISETEEIGEVRIKSSDVAPTNVVAPTSLGKPEETAKDVEQVKNMSSEAINTTPAKPKYRSGPYW